MTRRNIALIALMLLFFQIPASEGISLEEALQKKLIDLVIKGQGGFTGPVIEMKLKNISQKPITISIERGRLLHPDNKEMQDILVTQSIVVTLPVKAEKQLLINGMCCKAGNTPPSPGMTFKTGKMADSSLIRITQYIDQNKLYKDPASQHAVWVLSDQKRIEGIDVTVPSNKPLIELVCKLKHTVKPVYSIEYEQEPGMAFSGKAVKVKGFFKTVVEDRSGLTMALYDSDGKQLSADHIPGPPVAGTYNFEYAFKVKGFSSGTYYGKVIIDGKVKSEVMLEL